MNATATLTKRETEIAELIAWGATKKEIANKLFLSERTIENHTRNIYEKTGVTKVNELSAWWFCRSFRISFDLSPIKRVVISLVMLLIIVSHEYISLKQNYNVLIFRKIETLRQRRKEDTINYLTEL